jgi:hypothetical protein
LDLSFLARFDAAGIGTDNVLFGRGRFDLERDGMIIMVFDDERLFDHLRKWP